MWKTLITKKQGHSKFLLPTDMHQLTQEISCTHKPNYSTHASHQLWILQTESKVNLDSINQKWQWLYRGQDVSTSLS
jgi:hypothetical protein